MFGRFPVKGRKDTLEQYLGEFFPVVAAMSQMPQEPSYMEKPAAANWRLCYHITLDDYHAVAVHPSTFGKLGYQDRKKMVYHREGLHSAFLSTNDPDAMTKMIAQCRDGTFRSSKYRIVHIFPDMFITHLRSDAQHWHIILQQYVPVAHDRSLLRIWVNPAPFPADHPWYERFTGPFTNPVRKHIVNHYVKRVTDEDNVVCERIQADRRPDQRDADHRRSGRAHRLVRRIRISKPCRRECPAGRARSPPRRAPGSQAPRSQAPRSQRSLTPRLNGRDRFRPARNRTETHLEADAQRGSPLAQAARKLSMHIHRVYSDKYDRIVHMCVFPDEFCTPSAIVAQ